MFVYVLRCKEGKYYVGRTSDLYRRLNEHWTGGGSEWTRLYSPVAVDRVIETTSTFVEGNYVKEYMHTHGIDNVRGGAYVTRVLSKEQKQLIVKEIREAKNLCMTCGSANHFCSTCPIKNRVPPKRQGSPRSMPIQSRAPPPVQSSPPPRQTRVPPPVQSSPPPRQRHRSPSPSRMVGLAWTDEEDARLINEHATGYDVSTMAAYHERTPNAIRMRLSRLGLEY